MALVVRNKTHGVQLVMVAAVFAVVVALVAATIIAAIYIPQIAIWVPIIALGLALALHGR